MMNLIYFGKYKRRFENIYSLLKKEKTSNVIELCFGDTYIANFCKKNGIQWTGYDLNENFVAHAKRNHFNGLNEDIIKLDEFLKCDTYIMIGSLYHFKDDGVDLIRKMIQSSKQVIISEPIKNLSSTKGIIGFVARRSANTGKGHEVFRYNETSFIEMIEKLNVKYTVVAIDRDILIEIKK